MRQPKALSPTSLHLWERDREAFYTKYLADTKQPSIPSGDAASVGSAFDAFVKCSLYASLFGNDGDGEYDLKTLFDKQVDEVSRPMAWEAGKYAFEMYRECGVYDELLRELQKSEEDPRFEFTLTGEVGGVPLIGKPDLWYTYNVQVVYDWKVMGYCSVHTQSPKKFYKSCRDTWGPMDAKPTRGFKAGLPKPHPKYEEIDFHGHKIGSHWLEDVDKKWADQLAIYSWMLGIEAGEENMITGLDQLACKPNPNPDSPPLIRVAQHRCRISSFWQHSLLARLQDCWRTIHSGHIFSDETREESDMHCEMLDMQVASIGDENDSFWAEMNHKPFRG